MQNHRKLISTSILQLLNHTFEIQYQYKWGYKGTETLNKRQVKWAMGVAVHLYAK